jgi:hypothetical protein
MAEANEMLEVLSARLIHKRRLNPFKASLGEVLPPGLYWNYRELLI